MYRNSAQRGIFQSISDDERREQREALKAKTVEALIDSDPSDRIRYLYNEVLGLEEIWTAFDENDILTGWHDSKYNVDVVPIWPRKEFADSFVASNGTNWRPVPIPITDWIDVVTPDILESGNKIAAFPVDDHPFSILNPIEMLDDWENEWKRYAKYQLKDKSFEELSRDITKKS